MTGKDKQCIWHPYTPLEGVRENILIESAEGVYLITPEGRKIIDAVSSWWVNLHGHSNGYIAEAIAEQARKLEHVIFAGFTHPPAIRLAERLIEIIPGRPEKIFFSDNGSTAVEVGIKMALQYWFNLNSSKKKIIAIEGAYHGDTFGAMSVGERGAFTKPFSTFLFEAQFIDFPSAENEEKVVRQFEQLTANKDIAAFIYEPLVQGAAGMRMYSPQVLEALLAIARKNEVLCIADEVMTGFGRTGKLFASAYCETTPDIVCMSKGITGGVLPLGATSCTSGIVSAFSSADWSKTFFHGHSFTANPIACAAANASMDLLQSDECQRNITAIAEHHKSFIREIEKLKSVEKASSTGVILSIEIKTNGRSGYFNDLRNYLYDSFLDKNILLRPLGNIIYILPPYIISKKQLDEVYSAIKQVLMNLS